MTMTRLLPLAAVSTLLLSGCGGMLTSEKVTYDLTINVSDEASAENLINAAMRVIERRLDNMGVVNAETTFGDTYRPSITVTMPDAEGAAELTRQLTDPFVMDIMKQTASGAVADISVEGHGGFSKTDISTQDFIGVEVGQDAQKVTRARILMTDAGRAKMNALFKTEAGKSIGVFVRGKLISKLAVKSDALTDDLQIQGIPNLLIAEAFSDDVNVGLHVVYTPKP